MRLPSVQCVTIRNENIMDLTRRQFLQMVGGSATGAVLFAACGVPEESRYINSPHQMPEDLVTGLDNWYATLCRQCTTSDEFCRRRDCFQKSKSSQTSQKETLHRGPGV